MGRRALYNTDCSNMVSEEKSTVKGVPGKMALEKGPLVTGPGWRMLTEEAVVGKEGAEFGHAS